VREGAVRGGGLLLSILYAAVIVWTYSQQPRTMSQVTGGLASTVGAYRVDQQAFADGLAFFRKDQFEEARAAFSRADPAERDAVTRFYIAYSYYREGWGRLYNDDTLFAQGLKQVDLAIALAPGGRLVVDDAGLKMHTADELRAELSAGTRTDSSDFDPRRLFRERK
jgi:hypothetical protein